MTIRGLQRVASGGVMAEFSQAWWIRWAGMDDEFSQYFEHPESGRIVYDPPRVVRQ